MSEEETASRQKAEGSSGGDSPQSPDLSPQAEESQDVNPAPKVSQKTQGVRPSRDHGVGVLQSAAKKAARSNSRSDVHEYMRLRRGYV